MPSEKPLQFAFNFPLIILFSTFRSATIGVKSKNHAVLLALKRASSELSAYQKKIMILDDHIGMYNTYISVTSFEQLSLAEFSGE